MRDTRRFDAGETSRIRWATPDEARHLIAETTKAEGRARDLAILEAALEARALVAGEPVARWPDGRQHPGPTWHEMFAAYGKRYF